MKPGEQSSQGIGRIGRDPCLIYISRTHEAAREDSTDSTDCLVAQRRRDTDHSFPQSRYSSGTQSESRSLLTPELERRRQFAGNRPGGFICSGGRQVPRFVYLARAAAHASNKQGGRLAARLHARVVRLDILPRAVQSRAKCNRGIQLSGKLVPVGRTRTADTASDVTLQC